jgi:Inner membrane component of T3SS, cytoplasmic domain
MQAACTHCGTEHVLKDSDVGAHPKVQFHCAKCGMKTIVDTRRNPNATMVISPLPSFARGDSPGSSGNFLLHDNGAKLPATHNVMLTIISGPGKGTSHKLSKPRVVVGREGADIALQDPEISRHHCIIEVRDSYVNLRDLDSTNGTFFEEERVRAAMLVNDAEFRIGETILRITFAPK